jgi:putative transposase
MILLTFRPPASHSCHEQPIAIGVCLLSRPVLRERRDLTLENLALRQQLAIHKRSQTRLKIKQQDRLFWIWLPRTWTGWREDLFTVPTATFRVLFCLVVLRHDRRRVLHFNVTEHPTAQWAAQQLVEAFPEAVSARYLLRDRDSIYGDYFRQRVRGLGLKEVLSAPRSPWQNPCVERQIGSIRRECLDHVIVLNERHLRRILQRYFGYYHRTRTHLSVDKDAPDTRPVQLPAMGKVIEIAEVGGLHHRYERRAA